MVRHACYSLLVPVAAAHPFRKCLAGLIVRWPGGNKTERRIFPEFDDVQRYELGSIMLCYRQRMAIRTHRKLRKVDRTENQFDFQHLSSSRSRTADPMRNRMRETRPAQGIFFVYKVGPIEFLARREDHGVFSLLSVPALLPFL